MHCWVQGTQIECKTPPHAATLAELQGRAEAEGKHTRLARRAGDSLGLGGASWLLAQGALGGQPQLGRDALPAGCSACSWCARGPCAASGRIGLPGLLCSEEASGLQRRL